MNEAANKLAEWRAHPAQMVEEQFGVKPDPWQADVLEAFPHQPRIAMKAAKGPGKTCLLAWLAWNFLETRPHPKGAAVSNSGDNLRDNFWAEMAKWRAKSSFLMQAFEWTKTRIFAREAPETWFLSARTYPQSADATQQANTLAGMHADYVFFILDESGSMPDAVMVAADAALSSCIEGHIVQAGNPTHLTGPLYRACAMESNLWYVVEITGDPDDEKRSPRISLQWAREMIQRWGKEHPYVLVNVFGRFPPSSFNALIGPDEVRAAMERYYSDFHLGVAPRILGVDVARFGDDSSVIARRHGLQLHTFKKYRNIDSSMGAAAVSREWTDWNADAAFIDATGGFGSGWIDQLIQLGRAPIGVQFAGEAHQAARYSNKRAEMYFEAVEWIKRGGALPKDDNLLAQLVATTFTYEKRGDRFIIEPKDMVKAKLNGQSPDEADAFILTFAEPVVPKGQIIHRRAPSTAYDPFADFDKMLQSNRRDSGYDPLA